MAKIIVTFFRPNEFGRVWGVLATSSRVGTLIATFCLGGLLAIVSWQTTLIIAGVAGILATGYFFLSLKSAESESVDSMREEDLGQPHANEQPMDQVNGDHPLHGTSVPQAVGYFFRSKQFWLITGSLMGLTIMWDFLLFVPLYLHETLGMTPSGASMASSAFPFGSLISVLVGGFVFDKLNRRLTAWLMGALLTVAAGCILTFHLMSLVDLSADTEVGLSLALLFTFGLCVSPCYYIPMSVFSIDFGGPHSGFLIALLDALAFGAMAAFYSFAGDLAEESWTLFLFALLAVAVWSMLTTLFFMLGEARRLVTQEHA